VQKVFPYYPTLSPNTSVTDWRQADKHQPCHRRRLQHSCSASKIIYLR